jgi:hypothetical protein
MSLVDDATRVEPLPVLSRFRTDLYACMTTRADTLFDLTDAVLCAEGPVRTLVDLTLVTEHRRGQAAMSSSSRSAARAAGTCQDNPRRSSIRQTPDKSA